MSLFIQHYRRYDLPLDKDAASRFLPWIVGVMVFLAVLALAAFCVTRQSTHHWQASLAGVITVQIAAETGDETAPSQAQRVDDATHILKSLPGVSVKPVTADEAQDLLRPWLGDGVALADLPVPVLLEVTTTDETSVETLQLRLKGIPGISIDDHQAWLDDLLKIVHIIEGVSLIILGLVMGATLLIITFMTRAGLSIHTVVIDLLHGMGATDRYIAGQFQRYAFHLSLKGGAGGLICGAFVILATALLQGHTDTLFLPSFRLNWGTWGLLFCVPLITVFIASLTARVIALRALSRLP